MSRHFLAFRTLLLALTFALYSFSGASGQEPNVEVETSIDAQGHEIVTLAIPATDDQVAWADVTKAIVRAAGLDDNALADVLPTGKVSLHSPTTSLMLLGAGVASKGNLKFAVSKNEAGTSVLKIICDRTAIQLSRSEKADMILKNHAGDVRQLGTIVMDEGWQNSTSNLPLVVCVHGYSSGPSTFDDMREWLRSNKFVTGAFGYDFRSSIETSGKLLSAECRKLEATRPDKPLVLVAHSMGGLVSRAMLELPGTDPGNVIRLITIGTPNCGSMWAHCPPLLSARNDNGFDFDQVARLLMGASDDPGFRDLKPGSAFLERINALPRNPRVQYTVITGTGGPLSSEESEELRASYAQWKAESRAIKLFGPKFDPLMSDLAEVTSSLGDGAVAVCRSELPGVDDVLSFPFQHSEVLRQAPDNGHEAVWQAVLERCSNLQAKPQDHPLQK